MSRRSRQLLLCVLSWMMGGGVVALACGGGRGSSTFPAAEGAPPGPFPGLEVPGADGPPPSPPPSCGCDAGGVVRLRVAAGDGDTAAITLAHGSAACGADGPWLSRVCGTLILAACAEPDGGAPCIRLPQGPLEPRAGDYVDEDGGAWDLVDASLEMHIEGGIFEGTLSAGALRVGSCDASDCSRQVTGDYAVCALYEGPIGCD